MESINLGKNQSEITISLIEFQDDDNFIVYSPSLDVSGYGSTLLEARKSFNLALEEFLRYTFNKGTFLEELKRLGWIVDKKGKKVHQPHLDVLLRDREYLSQIVREKEFSRVNSSYSIPELA